MTSAACAAAVRETQQDLLRLMRHEHASLSLAQRCSGQPASSPLFSALFNYRHGVRQEAAGPALEGIEVLQSEERTNYPFVLSVDDLGEGFTLAAQVDGVDPARICGYMQGALEVLVRALEEAPQTPLCGLDVLAAEERQQLLVDWNATAACCRRNAFIGCLNGKPKPLRKPRRWSSRTRCSATASSTPAPINWRMR